MRLVATTVPVLVLVDPSDVDAVIEPTVEGTLPPATKIAAIPMMPRTKIMMPKVSDLAMPRCNLNRLRGPSVIRFFSPHLIELLDKGGIRGAHSQPRVRETDNPKASGAFERPATTEESTGTKWRVIFVYYPPAWPGV